MSTKLLQLLSDNRKRCLKNGITTRIVQAAGSSEATLYLYDAVVSDRLTAEYWGGVCAQDLVPQIAAIEADVINLRINSPGGDVFAAQSISAALEAHPAKVVGHIDGIAASAATRIACACDEVIIASAAMYMIHDAWTFAVGNRIDLQKTVALLEKVDATLAGVYAQQTGQSIEQITGWMDAETWFTAQEALDHGFANRMADAKGGNTSARANANAWDLSAYANAPKAFCSPPKTESEGNEANDSTPKFASDDHRARQQQRLHIVQRIRSV